MVTAEKLAMGEVLPSTSEKRNAQPLTRSATWKVCTGPNKKASSNEDAIFDSLCATSTDLTKPTMVLLDHHTYEIEDCWDRRSSNPQPFITVTASLHTEDYKRFDIFPGTNTHTIKARAMADTCCQSYLIGLNLVKQLGINKEKLIPVNMRMHAANNNGITILGAVFLRLTGTDSIGRSI